MIETAYICGLQLSAMLFSLKAAATRTAPPLMPLHHHLSPPLLRGEHQLAAYSHRTHALQHVGALQQDSSAFSFEKSPAVIPQVTKLVQSRVSDHTKYS